VKSGRGWLVLVVGFLAFAGLYALASPFLSLWNQP